ncbi:MAG: hypothetical protein ABI300_01400 [Rhodanobacter sp.]
MSTVPGDLLDDRVPTPRSMAIKLLGVPGARLPGDDADTTQDFLMVNGPAFNARDAKHFLASLKLVAATTDKAETLKKAFSAVAHGAEKTLEALGGNSPTLVAMGSHPPPTSWARLSTARRRSCTARTWPGSPSSQCCRTCWH